MLPRHLPPAATPLPASAVAPALNAPNDANERLRSSLNALFGARQSFLASSGRTALYLLLTALKEEQQATHSHSQRNEVVLPAYTCPSVAKVIVDAQLQPRLVDIHPHSMVVQADDLTAAIGPRTLAVILIHPFGIAHDIEPSLSLAQHSGAVLIEDVAQSMGARSDGRLAGTRGHYGLFSLGPGKPISAGGGGIVCVGDLGDVALAKSGWRELPDARRVDNYVALARLAAFQGAFQPMGWWLAMRAGAQKAGDDEANWGFSLSGLTPAQATIADEQLTHLHEYNRARRAKALQMIDGLADIPGIALPTPGQGVDVDGAFFLRLPLLFDDPQRCLAVHDALQAQGIGAGRMYKRTLPELFTGLDGHFPGAEAVATGLLTLPTHHHVRRDDLATVIETVNKICR
jgi:perosamine synthetase